MGGVLVSIPCPRAWGWNVPPPHGDRRGPWDAWLQLYQPSIIKVAWNNIGVRGAVGNAETAASAHPDWLLLLRVHYTVKDLILDSASLGGREFIKCKHFTVK